MHTLSDDKKDGYEIGILSLYPHRPEKEHSLAGIPLVRVPKPRFSSKYSGQLRSPHKLKFPGTPLILSFYERIVVLIGLLGGKVARIDDLEPLAECL